MWNVCAFLLFIINTTIISVQERGVPHESILGPVLLTFQKMIASFL